MWEGILNVDKPEGMTSHDVVYRVRRLSGTKRVGHAGTLDPLATGVLIVCLGRATRMVEYLMGQLKTYETTIRLGQNTNTYDAEGEIVQERPIPPLPHDTLETFLAPFRGSIQQHPPAYSAIKQAGKPLYKLARQGLEVETKPRTITIYALETLEIALPVIRLRVVCSAGTYIRSLAHDLGQVIGCGGHVAALRRTAVGNFTTTQAAPLDTLTPTNLPQHLQPSDSAVLHLPLLQLDEAGTKKLQQGQPIPRQPHHPLADLVRVYGPHEQFAGLVTRSSETWQPHKMFSE